VNVEQIVTAVAEKAGISVDQARRAVEALFEEMKRSEDEEVRSVAAAALATTTATLVTTVLHRG